VTATDDVSDSTLVIAQCGNKRWIYSSVRSPNRVISRIKVVFETPSENQVSESTDSIENVDVTGKELDLQEGPQVKRLGTSS
jgi:hypothetical protein